MIVGFKKWWRLIAAVWALLAFVAWHYESRCGVFFSPSCAPYYWEGARWVVLLKWVSPYQTLLGGFAALAAGAFVLIAARQTAKESQEASRVSQRRAAIVACSIISGELRDAWYSLDKRLAAQTMLPRMPETPFTQFSTYIPVVHAIDPFLGALTSTVKRDAEAQVLSGQSSSFDNTREIVGARCIAMSRIIEFVSNNLRDDSTFKFEPDGPKVPGAGVRKLISPMGVSSGQLRGLQTFFDWTK